MANWRYQEGMEFAKDDEYGEDFSCINCDKKIYVIIKKGILIKDVLPKIKCENCGCLQRMVFIR